MKIAFLPDVLLYLEELSHILYLNHYFGLEESARKYVDDLIDDIKAHLPYLRNEDAPPYFDRYGEGMYYATFRKNKRTHWYVFFDEYDENGEIVLLVRFIGNNHTVGQYL